MIERDPGFVRQNRDLIVVAGLSALVLAIYLQMTGYGFINLDDNLYVYDNPVIARGLGLETIRWAFQTFHSANWHPLTWLSHALDVQFLGMNPGGHHSVNVVLHLVNSILTFVVFRRMTGRYWASAVLAALFAVHPAHVESVAWISERKDVLSTTFWLLTMWAYIRHTEADEDLLPAKRILTPRFALVLVLFALGLMAKPMLVTLPFVLLLLDHWPLRRIRKTGDLVPRVIEKLPLMALSAASSIITIAAQGASGAVESLGYLPLAVRLINAVVSYAKYILVMVYPADLAVMYPYESDFSAWTIGISAAILLIITGISIWQRKVRPYLLVGWLWYIGTMVPVIGIVQVGSQAIADRYTYIPYFGLFIIVVWGLSELTDSLKLHRYFAYGVIGAVIAAFTVISYRQAGFWKDNETLYRHTLSVTRNNHLIQHNLCHTLILSDRLDDGEAHCRQAIAIKPDYFEPYNTLGVLEFKRGRYAEAEADFSTAVLLSPNSFFAYSNLAQAQSRLGKPEEAENNLRKAVDLGGRAAISVIAPALSDIAAAHAAKENYQKSAENLRRLLFLQPDDPQAHARLAMALYYLERFDEAEAEAKIAVSLRPDLVEGWDALGRVLLRKEKFREAAQAFQTVVQLRPDFTDAKANLERARSEAK